MENNEPVTVTKIPEPLYDKIVIYPNGALFKPSEAILDMEEGREILKRLTTTLRYTQGGIGLAAPQIGINKDAFVLVINGSVGGFINCKITKNSGTISTQEGCLSIPSYYEYVERWKNITIEFQDYSGEVTTIDCDPPISVMVQHEMDHIMGTLFVDRLSRTKKNMFRDWVTKKIHKQAGIK